MQSMFACPSHKLTLKNGGKNQIMCTMNVATLCFFTAVWNRSFGAQTRVHLPSSTRNLQALDRLIRTIGELCARRLDRISRLNVRQQGDRGLGLHSARVGKYIDVSSILLFARIGRSDQGSASVHGGVCPLCYHKRAEL